MARASSLAIPGSAVEGRSRWRCGWSRHSRTTTTSLFSQLLAGICRSLTHTAAHTSTEIKSRCELLQFRGRSKELDAAALRAACFQRFARMVAGEYEKNISAYNLTDWGLPAVHFIADFSWHQRIRERLDPVAPGFIYRDSWLRRIYLDIAGRYQNLSGRDLLREDKIIANSHWTAELMRKACEVEVAAVVYPPVCGEFPKVTWQDRENAFAMIGRIAPEKRIEDAIAILETVRQRGHAVQLHLCGQIGNDSYGRRIATLCRNHADWIVSEGFITGARKAEILATAKVWDPNPQCRAVRNLGWQDDSCGSHCFRSQRRRPS